MKSLVRIPHRFMAGFLVAVLAITYMNLFWMSWNTSSDAAFSRNQILPLPISTTATTKIAANAAARKAAAKSNKAFVRGRQDDDGGDDDDNFDAREMEVLLQQLNSNSSTSYEPILFAFARPMAMLRQNISLRTVYKFPRRNFSGSCSCSNKNATLECCSRTFRRSHKMGCVMTKDLLKQYEPLYRLAAEPDQFTYHQSDAGLPQSDYRDVLVLRNLYSSIVSGYLYHYKGFECGMAHKMEAFRFLKHWDEHISYELDPKPGFNHTLCRYLQNNGRFFEKRIVSVRAYVDWVMRYYYSGILSHWALAQQIPEVREHTLTVCYEDLMSEDRDLKSVHSIVDFFFDGAPPVAWNGTPPGHVNYDGGHATDHDTSIRNMVVKLIKEVDAKYYNGEIAWADSILPC